MRRGIVGRLATFVLSVLMLAVGCKGPEKSESRAEFAYGDRITCAEQTQWINIYSSEQWEITMEWLSGDEGWCVLSQSSGRGEGYTPVAISISPNREDRERQVCFVVEFPSRTIRLVLTQSPRGALLPYMELPAYEESDSRKMVTHYYNGSVRNFSVLYDTSHRLPLWVAYTLINSDVEGNAGRNEDWRYDPNLPAEGQPDLSRSFYGWYDRGHMLPSGSRQGSSVANSQTFFFSNIAPQLNGFNTGKWVDLENRVRTWRGRGLDTLYVVTGSVLQKVGCNEVVEKVGSYANSSKKSSVPNYYYKACLKLTVSGTIRSYKAIGVLLPHISDPKEPNLTPEEVMSIDELEALTGEDFFANLPAELEAQVEAACHPEQWGIYF